MKKILLITSALSTITVASEAQCNWSAGLRTGGELIKTYHLGNRSISPLLHEQFFITKKIIKNLEVEINGSYSSTVSNTLSFGPTNDGPSVLIYNYSYNYLEAGVALRYHFINRKSWSAYISTGINSGTTFSTLNSYNDDYYGWSGYSEGGYSSSKSSQTVIINKLYLGLGFNKTISNNFSLNAQSLLNYNYEGYNFTEQLLGDFNPVLQIGISYFW